MVYSEVEVTLLAAGSRLWVVPALLETLNWERRLLRL